MATKEDVIDAMKKMVARIANPNMEKHFREFNRIMHMTYSDLSLDISILFKAGEAKVSEGVPEDPDMTVVTDSTTILGILAGSVSAMRAFMGGKIKAEGSTRDLLKLQRLLKS
ncbi:MAG: SCP2 sterol-binding domain-containing protein [Candidatus Thorarchaeota archaeon]|jgi:putative sterol carrier protein